MLFIEKSEEEYTFFQVKPPSVVFKISLSLLGYTFPAAIKPLRASVNSIQLRVSLVGVLIVVNSIKLDNGGEVFWSGIGVFSEQLTKKVNDKKISQETA